MRFHPQDAGLLFKHTDYRSGGRSHAVRSRKLVVQMINTVANYGLSFFLGQTSTRTSTDSSFLPLQSASS